MIHAPVHISLHANSVLSRQHHCAHLTVHPNQNYSNYANMHNKVWCVKLEESENTARVLSRPWPINPCRSQHFIVVIGEKQQIVNNCCTEKCPGTVCLLTCFLSSNCHVPFLLQPPSLHCKPHSHSWGETLPSAGRDCADHDIEVHCGTCSLRLLRSVFISSSLSVRVVTWPQAEFDLRISHNRHKVENISLL